MAGHVTLVAVLHVDPDRIEEYERFEREASRIMARHGGRIERRVALEPPPESPEDAPHEVHVVTFPSAESFAAYRRDPDTTALSELRARAIRKTVLWHGRDLPAPITQNAEEES